MEKPPMIMITGAAGFIGSCLLRYLNEQGLENIILVDKFTVAAKEPNWKQKKFKHLVDRELLLEWLEENKPNIQFVVHLGARTHAAATDRVVLEQLNTEYSEDVWNYCTAYNIPLIYASSAATYGNGELGYDDDDSMLGDLKPQTACAISKHNFDKWAVSQLNAPPCWAGLKLFDVYGPNEYHKTQEPGEVWNLWVQAEKHGCIKLLKPREGSAESAEARDFIYVMDVVKVISWMYTTITSGAWNSRMNGIYNIGTGQARSLDELAAIVFQTIGKEPRVQYAGPTLPSGNSQPAFAQASIIKLKHAGYTGNFTSLEAGVKDYVQNYLAQGSYY